jgi:hypothetical protein
MIFVYGSHASLFKRSQMNVPRLQSQRFRCIVELCFDAVLLGRRGGVLTDENSMGNPPGEKLLVESMHVILLNLINRDILKRFNIQRPINIQRLVTKLIRRVLVGLIRAYNITSAPYRLIINIDKVAMELGDRIAIGDIAKSAVIIGYPIVMAATRMRTIKNCVGNLKEIGERYTMSCGYHHHFQCAVHLCYHALRRHFCICT